MKNISHISNISNQILDGETYRILIEKRNSDISSKEIITKIAHEIKNKGIRLWR